MQDTAKRCVCSRITILTGWEKIKDSNKKVAQREFYSRVDDNSFGKPYKITMKSFGGPSIFIPRTVNAKPLIRIEQMKKSVERISSKKKVSVPDLNQMYM